ncbi:MAG: hypothetical protein AAFQ12_14860, partial [Pseudomonadota bacterium]
IFSYWYGGKSKPVSAEEGAALIAQLRASYDTNDQTEEGLADHLEEMIAKDDDREFYAINLEKLKDGDAAQEADNAYARTVMPLLFERGSHPILIAERAGLMLGKYGEDVDRVVIVRYRSLRDQSRAFFGRNWLAFAAIPIRENQKYNCEAANPNKLERL